MKLNLYHPNSKGTGSALSVELVPATTNATGRIVLRLKPQKESLSTSFDDSKEIIVSLDVFDVAEFLKVFRGCEESIADGKGLFHRTMDANFVIKLEHRIEPRPGYLLELSTKENNPEGLMWRYQFLINPSEAIVLNEIFSSSLVYMAFGIPPMFTE
jgi:hypothetical protein